MTKVIVVSFQDDEAYMTAPVVAGPPVRFGGQPPPAGAPPFCAAFVAFPTEVVRFLPVIGCTLRVLLLVMELLQVLLQIVLEVLLLVLLFQSRCKK